MIVGIGVDICKPKRLKKIYRRFGDRFAHKILTAAEFKQFELRGKSHRFLATRFAAKEAVVKALGTGFRQGINLQSIEVVNDKLGKPELQFYQAALQVIKQKSINVSHLSLSDERSHVVAMVVLESCTENDGS